ncbi:hypothetical protein ACOMHN_026056 [Nucella lapillus]
MEKTSASASQHVKTDEVHKGKWIGLSEITYKDPQGRERKWEGVFRTTKIGDGSDAVVIIPVVKRKGHPDSVILVSQYRPPIKGYSLEFPAGLIDKGEDPVQCAVRELKEETGYSGVHTQVSPGVSLDPGLASSTVNMVTIEIDGDEDCNKNPQQQQEFIEVMTVPMEDLLNTLNKYAKDKGVVHSILYTYAMAMAHLGKPCKAAL